MSVRGGVVFLLVVVALAACGSEPSGSETTGRPAVVSSSLPPDESITTSTPPPSPTTSTTRSSVATTSVPLEREDLALFLAAVDGALVDTPYDGAVFVDAESFLAMGAMFCRMLSQGLSTDEVLTGYISALAAGAPGGEIADEDLLLGGVVLGASIQILCPAHSNLLES